MNKEFAVEPTAFENALQLKYILEKFGFFQGRFIVSFPSKWVKQAYDHVQRFPEMEQLRARRLLERYAKSSVVPSGGLAYEPTLPWTDNVFRVAEDNPSLFNGGVIAANFNSLGYPTVHDLDDDFFDASHDTRVPGNTENYGRVAKRLLQMSHEVVFVDPYLRIDRLPCEKVMKRFLAIAQQGNCRSFVLWARYNIASIKDYPGMLKMKYQQHLLANSKLFVNLVDDQHSTEKMHARLMLSSLGGLRFDHGFEEFDDKRKVDISLISQKAHDIHCRWYIDPNSQNDFNVVEKYSISGQTNT